MSPKTSSETYWSVLKTFNNRMPVLLIPPLLINKKTDTAQKTIFPKSWNITKSLKRPSKYHLSINFLAEKRSYFPSSKSSEQELFSN